jgi:hypothetical protein
MQSISIEEVFTVIYFIVDEWYLSIGQRLLKGGNTVVKRGKQLNLEKK